jgi:hypothetical protein
MALVLKLFPLKVFQIKCLESGPKCLAQQKYKSLIREPTRRLGVLSGGYPFLVLFWANKKVQNKDENQILQETQVK